MNFSQFYLKLGYEHILNVDALDHLLFLVVLCAIYKASEWKKVILLATAFTVGHSLTLGLANFDIIRFSPKVVEVLIPSTILFTAVYNFLLRFSSRKMKYFVEISHKYALNYVLAAIFGLIHGMAFSNDLRSMMMPGEENQLFKQLFAFNVGVEMGQFLVIAGILLGSWFAFEILKVKEKYWVGVISGLAGIISIFMIIERIL